MMDYVCMSTVLGSLTISNFKIRTDLNPRLAEGISKHPHPQFATYLKSTTPSENIWEDMIPGAPGRRACDNCKRK